MASIPVARVVLAAGLRTRKPERRFGSDRPCDAADRLLPGDSFMLTFSEEILVLLIDGKRGTLSPDRRANIECAFAAAVLMDLAFANRIDTDPARLFVTDRTPTGNPMLDRILASIGARQETADTRTWIETLAAEDAAVIREQASLGLIERGTLAAPQGSFRRPFAFRRGEGANREVKLRIAEALLDDDIPDPRDAALIGLVEACDLVDEILPGNDIGPIRARIGQLRRMDLIGRELGAAISEIEHGARVSLSGRGEPYGSEARWEEVPERRHAVR